MGYFDIYSSNTIAGTSSQCFFESDGVLHTSRVFYRIFAGGRYNYSFLYTNTVDSTYLPVAGSVRNMQCDRWEMKSIRVSVCPKSVFDIAAGHENMPEMAFCEVTVDGASSKVVEPGEVFSTDAVELCAEKDDYICIEMSFVGSKMPRMNDLNIAGYELDGDKWIESNRFPVPSMIGCDRNVKLKVAFFGDSITQGIGTEKNSYTHWNALLSGKLSSENAYWNIGISGACGNDAATFGNWFDRAKHNDLVVMCFGVNDIMSGRSYDQLTHDLESLVSELYENGCKVILQTVPPFLYNEPMTDTWKKVNDYIRNVLSEKVEAVFDNTVFLLGEGEGAEALIYGDHPNADGCRIWADAIYPCVEKVIKKYNQ